MKINGGEDKILIKYKFILNNNNINDKNPNNKQDFTTSKY